jgi:hypothetical protein
MTGGIFDRKKGGRHLKILVNKQTYNIKFTKIKKPGYLRHYIYLRMSTSQSLDEQKIRKTHYTDFWEWFLGRVTFSINREFDHW